LEYQRPRPEGTQEKVGGPNGVKKSELDKDGKLFSKPKKESENRSQKEGGRKAPDVSTSHGKIIITANLGGRGCSQSAGNVTPPRVGESFNRAKGGKASG